MPRINEVPASVREYRKKRRFPKAHKVASCTSSGMAMTVREAAPRKDNLKVRQYVDHMSKPASAGYLAAKALLLERANG